MIIIGSAPLTKFPKDLDIIVNSDEKAFIEKKTEGHTKVNGKDTKIEFHDSEFLTNADVRNLFYDRRKVMAIPDVGLVPYATFTGLAAIKRSHLFRPHKFAQHIKAYHNNFYNNPCTLKQFFDDAPDYVKIWTKSREQLTKEAFPRDARNPNLSQSNEDFFDDNVEKKYDHDDIHAIVAFEDEPMFTRLKKTGKEGLAWCEEDLWNALTHEQKIQCVQEEAYVISLERFIIPDGPDKVNFAVAYITAVGKICTTLCSGYFRDFAIDNWKEVMTKYSKHKQRDALIELGEMK